MVYQGKSDFISKLAKKLKHQIPEYFWGKKNTSLLHNHWFFWASRSYSQNEAKLYAGASNADRIGQRGDVPSFKA